VPFADTCEPFASSSGCSSTPSWDQFNAEVSRAVGNIFGALFHGGPQMVLVPLIVLWALGRVIAWASVLFLGRSKKGEQ
jgi:hypothetical protein